MRLCEYIGLVCAWFAWGVDFANEQVQTSWAECDEGTGYWDSSWSRHHHARYVFISLFMQFVYSNGPNALLLVRLCYF
jgi:hypothetical protein